MWFTKSNEEVLKEVNVDPLQGLSEEEAKLRLEKHGPVFLLMNLVLPNQAHY